MCMSTPSAPKPPPMLPEAPTAPKQSVEAGAARKRKAMQGNTNILTGPMGLTNPATTAQKTLLGS